MLDPKKVRLGICPIGWSNDDMWDLGDENTFQQCISEMKLAAAKAIASCVSDEELTAEYIMPMAFDKKVIRTVADAVAQAARDSGVARI